MQLPQRDEVVGWIDLPVMDVQGQTIGPCRQVYADEATGVPEWLVAELADGQTAFVPLTDATSREGRVHVAFRLDVVATAPRFEDSGYLEPEQDIRLYEHYDVPYSRAASETVLPTGGPRPEGAQEVSGAQPADRSRLRKVDFAAAHVQETPTAPVSSPVPEPQPVPEPAVVPEPPPVRPLAAAPPSAPPPAQEPPAAQRPAPAPVLEAPARPAGGWPSAADAEPVLLGALAVALAVITGIRVLRDRRRATPTQSAALRLRSALQQTAEVQGRAAARSTTRLAAGANRVAATAAKEGVAAGRDLAKASAARRNALAKEAARRRRKATTARRGAVRRASGLTTGVRSAITSSTAATASSANAAASRGARGVSGLGGAVWSVPTGLASDVAHGSARRTRRIRRSWRRSTRRITLILGLVSGYVAGARAGRERYEQIAQGAAQVSGRPEVQRMRGRLPALLGGRRPA